MPGSFREIAKTLEEKSQVYMEDANVNEFRRCVMKGEFTNIKEPMKKLNMSQEQLKHIEYQLYEQ